MKRFIVNFFIRIKINLIRELNLIKKKKEESNTVDFK